MVILLTLPPSFLLALAKSLCDGLVDRRIVSVDESNILSFLLVDQDQTLTNQELSLKDESPALTGDSIDITELTALAEAAHQRVTGVGRSVSDEVMGQKRWQDGSS